MSGRCVPCTDLTLPMLNHKGCHRGDPH